MVNMWHSTYNFTYCFLYSCFSDTWFDVPEITIKNNDCNYIKYKIDKKIYKNYNINNSLLKTKYNRRNKFKNKRR